MHRLAAQMPQPYCNLVRYYGIFASNAKTRPKLHELLLERNDISSAESVDGLEKSDANKPRKRYLEWAQLLKRSFSFSPLDCPKCQQLMSVIAVITDPSVVKGILDHLKLPSAMPVISPARLPDQCDFDWSDDQIIDVWAQNDEENSARGPPSV